MVINTPCTDRHRLSLSHTGTLLGGGDWDESLWQFSRNLLFKISLSEINWVVFGEDKVPMNWLQSHGLFLYVDTFPFETGSQSECVVLCLTDLHNNQCSRSDTLSSNLNKLNCSLVN